MQVFRVVLEVTVNTIETISETELKTELNECLSEFSGGSANVVDIEEYS